MNKKIKFRAFYDKKNMVYSKTINKNYEDAINFFRILEDVSESASELDMPIMQFTGLKDKNGQDIYEGDIIKMSTDKKFGENKIAFVYWDDKRCNFSTNDNKNNGGWFPNIRKENNLFFEVIGNIYENKNLLNK